MEENKRSPMIGGLILIAIGAIALLANWMPGAFGESLPVLILGGLGLIFIIAGIVSRESGFFVPGGILSGLGLGIALTVGPFSVSSVVNDGSAFLLGFAAGWFLIPVLSIIFTRERHLWALIPGAIIGLVGLAVQFGGFWSTSLEWLGKLWPIALIAGGLYAIVRARRHHDVVNVDEKPVEKHA